MAGKFTRLQKSYRIATDNVNPATTKNEIPLYRGVVLADKDTCKLPETANMVPLGVVDSDERLDDPVRDGGSQAGRQIAVKLEGVAMMELSGVVLPGDRIILDAGGFASPILESGAQEVVGFAEVGGREGDVIPVRMSYHTLVITEEEVPVPPVIIEGYYKDESGTALKVEATVDKGTEDTDALAELDTSGYAKLSDNTYAAITITWAFVGNYDKETVGDYTVTGTVVPSTIEGAATTALSGKITVNE